jgi:hypothetical protein
VLLGVEDISLVSGEEINSSTTFLVFLNGLIVGAHARPIVLVDKVYYYTQYNIRYIAVITGCDT